jgi:hypothetical protein
MHKRGQKHTYKRKAWEREALLLLEQGSKEEEEMDRCVARHSSIKRDNGNSARVNRVFNRSQSDCICVTHLREQTLISFSLFVQHAPGKSQGEGKQEEQNEEKTREREKNQHQQDEFGLAR